jgi:hypothetical protein
LTDHPFASLFNGSKSFRQNIIKGFSLGKSDLEFLGFCFDLLIRKSFIFGIESIDSRYQREYLIDLVLIVISGNKFQNIIKHTMREMIKNTIEIKGNLLYQNGLRKQPKKSISSFPPGSKFSKAQAKSRLLPISSREQETHRKKIDFR